MRKSKRGPAFYELLGKDTTNSEALKVPRWWGHADEPAGSGETTGTPEKAPPQKASSEKAPSEKAPLKKAPEAVQASQSMSKPPGQPGSTAPLIELDGVRIRVSFTSLTAAVVIFAGLVLVLAAFGLGHWIGNKDGLKQGYAAGRDSYAAEASDEIKAVRRKPPATHLIESLLKDSGAQAQPGAGDADDAVAARDATEPARSKWIRDYTYVVAQEFPAGHTDDVRRAQEFLAQYGVSTERVRYPSGSMQLITTQGYDRNDPAQRRMADELLKKVRTVGAKYFAAGGGYKLEGYFKTLKDDTW